MSKEGAVLMRSIKHGLMASVWYLLAVLVMMLAGATVTGVLAAAVVLTESMLTQQTPSGWMWVLLAAIVGGIVGLGTGIYTVIDRARS